MKTLLLGLTTAGIIGLIASATPVSARIAGSAAPSVETNTVNARCNHHRRSSRWHCWRRHHNWHAQPFYWQPHHYHHRWHSRRHH